MNCFMCKGHMFAGTVNHIVDIEGSIIIVRNVPANVCKQCGEAFFDHDVTKKLEEIVEQAKQSKAEIAVINYFDKVA
jgi:YgiT-type zinc finger domain-containing protein